MNDVTVSNPNLSKQETTYLTADASAGSSVALTVKNNQGFAANDIIIVEFEGKEKAEQCQVSSVTGNTTITVSTLALDHLEGAKIIKIPYDQVQIAHATAEDGSYTELGFEDINYDDKATYLTHNAGSSSTWYKSQFKNSVSGVTSSWSAAFQITDAGHYCTIDEIMVEAGFEESEYIDPEYVYKLRRRARSEIDSSLYSHYDLPLSTVPDIIKDVAKLLAAGWLLYKEYGAEADGTSKDGISKIKEARGILKSIRKSEITLLDTDNEPLTRTASSLSDLEGWPDDTTEDADDDDGGGDVSFRVSDKF